MAFLGKVHDATKGAGKWLATGAAVALGTAQNAIAGDAPKDAVKAKPVPTQSAKPFKHEGRQTGIIIAKNSEPVRYKNPNTPEEDAKLQKALDSAEDLLAKGRERLRSEIKEHKANAAALKAEAAALSKSAQQDRAEAAALSKSAQQDRAEARALRDLLSDL